MEIYIHTRASVWSKTSLNTGSVGGAGADSSTCKIGTLFLMSLSSTQCRFAQIIRIKVCFIHLRNKDFMF